jgi:nicotinamidase-related amidase
MNKPYVKLDRSNVAVLLVDHQAGLLSLVRDMDPDRFRNNVLALADLARYFQALLNFKWVLGRED